MSFWDDIKEKASWAAGQLGETLDEVKDRTQTEYNIYRIQRQVGVLQEEAEELYKKLGRRSFELASEGRIDDPEVKGLTEEVQAKKDKVAEKEAEIEKVRALVEEERKKAEEAARKQAEANGKAGGKADDEVDGEAIWEDNSPRDDGTPPPP